MKYKIGDKFKKKEDVFGAFWSGKIVATIDDDYILSVEGHAFQDSPGSYEDEILVRRGTADLDSRYELVPSFFEEGKTYKFKDSAIGSAYEVTKVFQNKKSADEKNRLQALALRTDSCGYTNWTLLNKGTFDSMEEDLNW